MKRAIAIVLIAIPLGVISLLPKPASASEIRLQAGQNHSSVVIAQRGYDTRRNEIRREEIRREQARRRENNHRVWVPAHWEQITRGRRWVTGQWVYRRI
jgi:ActR/RegA family two-component response regulator